MQQNQIVKKVNIGINKTVSLRFPNLNVLCVNYLYLKLITLNKYSLN